MFEMAVPIQSPAICEVRSVIRFLNAKGERPAEIHKQTVAVYGNVIPEVFKTTIHEAVPEKLGYRKLCACWVPKMLIDNHKRKRMGFALKFLMPYAQEGKPMRHILPIHNVTINSTNMFVNFRWTFNFCVEKSYYGTHLAFGGTLDRRCRFKHVSLKAGSTTVKRARLTGKRSRSTAVLP